MNEVFVIIRKTNSSDLLKFAVQGQTYSSVCTIVNLALKVLYYFIVGSK